MFSFGRNHNLTIVLDIGSASVGAALVLLSDKDKPRVAYSKRFPIATKEKPRATELIALMKKTLTVVLDDVAKNGVLRLRENNLPTKPGRVIAVFAAPWYSPDIKAIDIKEKSPITITDKFIDQVIDRELKSYHEEFSKSKMELIERQVMSITLNGYAVPEPFGKKAREVRLSIFLSAVPQTIIKIVESEVSRAFNLNEIEYFTFPLLAYGTIINLFAKENDFIFVDITGEVTDMSVVLNDTLVENISFPSGHNLPLRRIAKDFDVSAEIARSMIKTHLEGAAEEAISRKIAPMLSDSQSEWLLYFNQSIQELRERVPLPGKMFITTDPTLAGFFTDCLSHNNSELTGGYQPTSTTLLNRDSLREYSTFDQGQVQDPFVAIIASYLGITGP